MYYTYNFAFCQVKNILDKIYYLLYNTGNGGKDMKKPRSANEMAKTIRHIWEINPVTRIVKGKKKYTRKHKHKNKEEEI